MTRPPEPAGGDAAGRGNARRVSSRPTRRVESPNASSQVDIHPGPDSGRDRRSRSGAVPAAARVGARRLARIQAGLLPRDHAILCSLAQLRLASGRQLQALHFGTSPADARSARRTLIRLTEAQVLARLDRRVGGARAGSDGYVYAVGSIGERLLQLDRANPPRRRRRVGEVSDGFADHTLDIAEVFVRLQRARAQGQLEELFVQTEPRCWRQMSSADGEEEWLKPDLLVAATTRTNEHHSFVEVDRGTEHSPAILRKVRAYELAYRLGVTAVSREIFPRVVWLTPDARRTEFLSDLLLRDSRATPELHLVAPLSDALAVLTGGEVSDERVVGTSPGVAS